MENVKEKVPGAKVKELLKGVPDSGMAEIVLKDPKRTGSITVRDYTLVDEEGGLIHRPFVDKNGNHRIMKYTKRKKLNLSRDNDRLEYQQALLHPHFTAGPNPVLIVNNLEELANDFIEEKDLVSKVNGIIQKLSGADLKKFCRVLLISYPLGSSDSAVKRLLYEKAELEPQEVLNEWEDPDRPLKELIREGVVKKVFTTTNGRWSCGGTQCGTTFEHALDWLKENEDLEPKLRKQIFAK